MNAGSSDEAYQDQILPHVSRTFALTIPQLPEALRVAVTNAYLLCRIADTVEDEPALSPRETLAFLERFTAVLAGGAASAPFARELLQRLTDRTLPTERDLVSHIDQVIRITAGLRSRQRAAIVRCVELMCYGMPRFQSAASLCGLAACSDLDEYCYYVAGVVGEMLTELFCDYSVDIAARRVALHDLAISFAQGLQMTNILKDQWEDRARGVCWLPQEVFARHGIDLGHLSAEPHQQAFAAGLRELIGVAHAHLRNALDYTLLIPRKEAGIRRFCLWAVGLAILTLRNIDRNLSFTAGEQVKVSRRAVALTRILSEVALRNDWMLRRLFRFAARVLPLAAVPAARPPRPAQAAAPAPSPSGAAPNRAAVSPADTAHLNAAIAAARDALAARQSGPGYWLFELEADCTIPAEYILMMHFLDEIDAVLERKLAVYLRTHQAAHGGWPLYHDGDFNISCTVKAYYALKLAGDDPEAPHMRRARAAALAHGGAARANVFTRIALAQFGQIPWRGVPYIPVEIMLLPRWFPFHIDKVSYWSRTVMVPLFILCTRKARANNPKDVQIAELFRIPPNQEHDYFRDTLQRGGLLPRVFLLLDRLGRLIDPLIPTALRAHATQRALSWTLERLNGADGLGAIFPAMVNALEALTVLGMAGDDPRRVLAKRALQKLLVESEASAYCQPCVSPVWDTSLAALAMQECGGTTALAASVRALDWLQMRQLLDEPGDWRVNRPDLRGGGWAFQFANSHYPDLDDTAIIVWAMHQSAEANRYAESIRRALDWLVGMQSDDGGFAAFDVDNTHDNLNYIPFADHGALLDPPTSDVTARVATVLARVGRPEDAAALARSIAYLRAQQEPDGSWFGRWGTNYVYGTWSVLSAFGAAGIGPEDAAVGRAVDWLLARQNADGGWGESNDTYLGGPARSACMRSTAYQSAWALLALLAAGRARSDAVHGGVAFLLRSRQADGLWSDPTFTAPGFPRVFYLRYHGYSAYFPLWALAAYRKQSLQGRAR